MDHQYWGYHLILDCADCNTNVSDSKIIYQFVKELVKEIDMVAHGEPIIELLLPGDPNQGYSLMQLITTSNICAHFVDSSLSAYIDVFSCKKFEQETVVKVVNKYFQPTSIKSKYLERQA